MKTGQTMIQAGWFNIIHQDDPGIEYKNWVRRLDPGYFPSRAEKLIRFQFWVKRLENPETGKMVSELENFCSKAGFDHEWLRKALHTSPPDPRGSAMLVYFSLAIYEREMNQGVAAIHKWEKDPGKNANKKFAWQLYQRMVEAQMVAIPGIFVTSNDRQRYKLICDTIHAVLKNDYQMVNSLVQDILEYTNLKERVTISKTTSKIPFSKGFAKV
jgi:hypothetical protein